MSQSLARHSVPVTYYFVDFGISTIFDPNDTQRRSLDQDVPELSQDRPFQGGRVHIG